MDWYLGCAVDDLLVPSSNQEMRAMFPSPNDWSQWELSSEALDPMNKYFVTQTNFVGTGTGTGLSFSGKFKQHQDEDSISSNYCLEFKEGSVNQGTSSWNVSDYQIDDLDMTNQGDDVFLNSSIDTGVDASAGPYNFCNAGLENAHNCVLPSDGLFEDMIIESECDASHLFGMGSSKYLKTHAFSPPESGGAGLYTPQFPKLSDNPPAQVKAQYEDLSDSADFEIMDGHINEETLSKTSILQELESAMTQMSDKMRICFRDAFYRLAESSSQLPINLGLERLSVVSDGNIRSGNSSNIEANTNVIDRTIANLMFYKMDDDVPNVSHCHSGDAEVPIFS